MKVSIGWLRCFSADDRSFYCGTVRADAIQVLMACRLHGVKFYCGNLLSCKVYLKLRNLLFHENQQTRQNFLSNVYTRHVSPPLVRSTFCWGYQNDCRPDNKDGSRATSPSTSSSSMATWDSTAGPAGKMSVFNGFWLWRCL